MRLLFFFLSPCWVEQSGTTFAPSSTTYLWPFECIASTHKSTMGLHQADTHCGIDQKVTVRILFGRHILGCRGKHFAALRSCGRSLSACARVDPARNDWSQVHFDGYGGPHRVSCPPVHAQRKLRRFEESKKGGRWIGAKYLVIERELGAEATLNPRRKHVFDWIREALSLLRFYSSLEISFWEAKIKRRFHAGTCEPEGAETTREQQQQQLVIATLVCALRPSRVYLSSSFYISASLALS